jgi:hypothetical protein
VKVSIQHDVPLDEFARQYGPIGGATFSEAHAALLRAQGIKPVNVETTYGGTQLPALVAQPLQEPTPVDLSPLYGIFIQLADTLTETRQRLEDRTVEQEKVNQALAQTLDEVVRRFAIVEQAVLSISETAERELNAGAN